MTGSYLLNGVPSDLWIKVKRRAEAEGRSIRWILLSLLTYYASKGMPK